MAGLEVLSDVTSALSTEFDERVFKQMNRKSVLLSLLTKKPGKGNACAWDVVFSDASADTYTEGADVTTATDTDQDLKIPASISWGWYRSNFGVSGLAKAVAANSPLSPDYVTDLIAGDLLGSASKLASVINGKLYDGTGAGHIIGLDSALAATGTYANIAKGSYAEWAGNVLANGGISRNLTKDLMDQMESTIYTDAGESPSVIVTTPAICRKYEQLFDSVTRMALPSGDMSPARANLGMVPDNMTGFSGYTYKGIPVFRDKDATSGHMYMLNLEYLELCSLPPPMADDTGVASRREELSDEQGRRVGLEVHYQTLAKTGDSDRFSLVVYPQLKNMKVCAHGLIDDISES